MSASFVLLTDGAASNKIVDEDREARPPEVTFHDGLSMEMSEVT